ncbi:hypothetical protein Tco_1553390 [Tanacetum coccineum]
MNVKVRLVDLTGDEDLTDEDGDIGMGDSIGVSASLGGEIFSGGTKSWESTSVEGQLLWKTVLSWRTVECKFNGKITVVILVRDKCPRGKGPLRNFFEQRIAAMMGYRGGSEECSTFPTKGMRSIISTVSISVEGFLASILLLMVIIIAAVIITVIRVVVVVVIIGVVIVVAIIGVIIVVAIIGIVVVVRIIGIVVVVGGGVPFIIKLSFVIIGFLHIIMINYLVH